MLSWQVGSAKITAIVEQPLEDLEGLITKTTPEELLAIDWLRPHFIDASGTMLGVVQSFVIEHAGKLIVVDTCIGDHKSLPISPHQHEKVFGLFEKFNEAGFDPAKVDLVLCTHMHFDHVGMNTLLVEGAWAPSFPNARYLFAKEEFDYWASENARPVEDPAALEGGFAKMRATFHATQVDVHNQSVQPVIDAGLAEIVAAPCEPLPGLRLVPTPGHTPGHVSVELISEGQRAWITGDSFHHPCQIARADWSTVADIDRDVGIDTRRDVLAKLAGSDTLLLGTHFSAPTGGQIVKDGESYRLEC